MKIIIIGERSFFSKELKKIFKKSKIVSTNFIKKKKSIRSLIQDNTIFIINSFYPLFKILNDKKNNKTLINQSVIFLINFLKLINKKKNIKIIYSSTCAVKNFNANTYNSRSVYTSVKIICEQILREYSYRNNVQLIITRLFNLYGGEDKASIIYKILKATKKNPIQINNNGNSKRDFIHVSDASKIYKNLIKSNFSGDIEIGSGKAVAIKKLIDLKQQKFIISKTRVKENKISKANIKILSKYFTLSKLINVKNFVKSNI